MLKRLQRHTRIIVNIVKNVKRSLVAPQLSQRSGLEHDTVGAVRPPPPASGLLDEPIERRIVDARHLSVEVDQPGSAPALLAPSLHVAEESLRRRLVTSGQAIQAVRLGHAHRSIVGRFVELFCQPASGFWRSVAVASRATKSAESTVNKGNPRKQLDAGGGCRRRDSNPRHADYDSACSRRLSPVSTGDSRARLARWTRIWAHLSRSVHTQAPVRGAVGRSYRYGTDGEVAVRRKARSCRTL